MAQEQNREFLEELRRLVQMNEFLPAIHQLVAFLAGGDRRLHNEAILLCSRFLSIVAKERRGLVSDGDAAVQKSRIGAAILDFIDEVERQHGRSQLPFPFQPVDFAAPEEASLEAIVGNNNLKSIAWLEHGLEVSRAVCRVVTQAGLGTGFLIGENRLVTNQHVIPDDDVASGTVVEFNFQEDRSNRLQPVSRYTVSRPVVKVNPALDYCVVEIDEATNEPPLASWGCLQLAPDPPPGNGEHVTIVQHPQGGVKQIAITANQVVNVFEHKLQYTTDTLPGSSGSPVFNDDWKVVALHHAGGNLITNARGDRMFGNQGILIAYIMADLGA